MDSEVELRRKVGVLLAMYSAHEIVDALIEIDVANVPSIEASLQGFYAATDDVEDDDNA